MTDLLLLAVTGGGLIASIVTVRYLEWLRWRQELVTYELRFPRRTDPTEVSAFMSGLAGLASTRWDRLIACPAVVMETTASAGGIAHRLLVPRSLAPVVLAALRAALPEVAAVETPNPDRFRATLAGELGLSNWERPLQVDAETVSAGLLASLQPLGAREQVAVQVTVSPVGPVPAIGDARRQGHLHRLTPNVTTDVRSGEALRAARAKQAAPLFGVTIRLGIQSGSAAGARSLLRRVTAAFHATAAPGVHLYRRRVPAWWSARGLERRAVPLVRWPVLLNADELAALGGFVVGSPRLPGLRLGTAPLVPVAAEIPRQGRVLAEATYPGDQRALAVSVKDSLKGMFVLGPPDSGKTTLFLSLLAQDVAAGRGVVAIAPKDLIEAALDLIPPQRDGDVILVDPSDPERSVGINWLHRPVRPELVASHVTAVFAHMFESWGPRVADVTRSAILTLALAGGFSLAELPLLLADSAFRRRLVARLNDPVLLGFWAGFDAMSEAERSQAVAPVLTRARGWLQHPGLRAILSQVPPTVNFDDVLARGRILLVSLNSGVLGAEAAALLGALIFGELWSAVERRAALPPDKRRPVMVFVDEWQRYAASVQTDFGAAIAMARGLGVGLHAANQNLAQLATDLRESALSNLRTKVVFAPGASDAHRLAQEFAPHLSAADLLSLGQHQAAVAVAVGSVVAPVTVGRTLPPPPGLGRAAVVRATSRQRWGRDRAEVEAAMLARQEARSSAGPLGQRPRASS